MIRILGDTHNEIGQFTEEVMPGESTWTKDDILIVAGDFGYVLHGEDLYLSERNNLNTLAQKSYTILFVDGNHEGFPYLGAYPEELHFGAPVRRIRKNIFWLQRGYIYEIEGHSFFVMGGAYSRDKDFRMKYFEICGEKSGLKRNFPARRSTSVP